MSGKSMLAFLVTTLFASQVSSQEPRVFMINANQLAEVKKKLDQKDEKIVLLIDSLKKEADDLLKMKPVSVMDKERNPVSGNKHDYMSQAPYFWYDSSKPNGLPYIRRDGERNPEIYKITDRTYIGRLENASKTLALAWYFTRNPAYADKATVLLHSWFLDDATKMNPNLEYAQAIPGVNDGRGTGIIESRTLMGITDAIGLLEGSSSWTKEDSKKMKKWYADYLDWLLNSKKGKDEHAAQNNHGTWYYAQVINFALFAEKPALAKNLAEESKKRLDSQLTPDGKQPLELARTNALGYSTMNLSGWFSVATLAEKSGVDLWNFKTSKGAGIRLALDWLTPYATGEKKWDYKQITHYNSSEFYTLLIRAAGKFGDPRYISLSNRTNKDPEDILNGMLY